MLSRPPASFAHATRKSAWCTKCLASEWSPRSRREAPRRCGPPGRSRIGRPSTPATHIPGRGCRRRRTSGAERRPVRREPPGQDVPAATGACSEARRRILSRRDQLLARRSRNPSSLDGAGHLETGRRGCRPSVPTARTYRRAAAPSAVVPMRRRSSSSSTFRRIRLVAAANICPNASRQSRSSTRPARRSGYRRTSRRRRPRRMPLGDGPLLPRLPCHPQPQGPCRRRPVGYGACQDVVRTASSFLGLTRPRSVDPRASHCPAITRVEGALRPIFEIPPVEPALPARLTQSC